MFVYSFGFVVEWGVGRVGWRFLSGEVLLSRVFVVIGSFLEEMGVLGKYFMKVWYIFSV